MLSRPGSQASEYRRGEAWRPGGQGGGPTTTGQHDRLSATVHPDGGSGATLVTLRGTLSDDAVAEVRNVLLASFAQGPSGVIVDLSDVRPAALSIFSPVHHRQSVPAALVPLVLCGVAEPDAPVAAFPDLTRAQAYLRAGRSDGRQRWIRLPPTRSAPSKAREFIADACRAWNRGPVRERVELIASELASNAVQHARTVLDVLVADRGERLHVGVRDASRELPRPAAQVVPLAALSGRGMRLVASCARDWGVAVGATGKLVWASLS